MLNDPDVLRFLSLDPLAADYPSLSDYSYVVGNPLMYVDPTGKSFENNDPITFEASANVSSPFSKYKIILVSTNSLVPLIS